MDRRHFAISGVGSLALLSCRSPEKTRSDRLFTSGILKTNTVAAIFSIPSTSLILPRTPLITDQGVRALADLRGKTRIVTLWAEWCAPCLAEMADFSRLNSHFRSGKFEVIAVLTGSEKKLRLLEAQSLLAQRGAVLPVWVELAGGAAVLNALCKNDLGEVSLPCTLIVDVHGGVRGRSFGAASAGGTFETRNGRLTAAGKAQMLASNLHTVWGTPAGDAFVSALERGALH